MEIHYHHQTTDADIIFNPDGSGDVMIPDDTKLGFGGGRWFICCP